MTVEGRIRGKSQLPFQNLFLQSSNSLAVSASLSMLVIARSASLFRLLTGTALTEPNGCGFARHPTVILSSFICSFPALSWPEVSLM